MNLVRPLTIVLSSVALLWLLATGPPTVGGATASPSDQQVLDHWRDKWGQLGFAPDPARPWRLDSTWYQVAGGELPPGADEFTSAPAAKATNPPPAQIDLFNRVNGARIERQIVRRVTPMSGPALANYFPVLTEDGTRFTFYDAAGAEPGESEFTCEIDAHLGADFLLCRVIGPPGPAGRVVRYDAFVRMVDAAAPVPPATEIMAHFRDLWGRTGFPESGVSPWRVSGSWRRTAVLAFDHDDTEFTGRPRRREPPKETIIYLLARTVRGAEEYQVVERAAQPDSAVSWNFFPTFSGTAEEFAFYGDGTSPVATPGACHESNRVLTVDGTRMLVTRTIAADGRLSYEIATPVDGAPQP